MAPIATPHRAMTRRRVVRACLQGRRPPGAGHARTGAFAGGLPGAFKRELASVAREGPAGSARPRTRATPQGSRRGCVGAVHARCLPHHAVPARCRRPRAAPAPDAVMSTNVEYLGSIKQDVGLTTGREDRRRPDVRHVRQEHLDLRHLRPGDAEGARRDEDQHRLGERGGADQRQGAGGRERLLLRRRPECVAALAADGCVQLFDVRDPAQHQAGRHDPDRQPHGRVRARLPVLLRPRRARSSTRAAILDGTPPKVVGNWIDELQGAGRRRAELPPHPRDPARASC